MRLKDKSAVVTGAASGIGRGISIAFAREGARVLLADINLDGAEETAGLIEKEGGTARPLKTDVSKKREIDAMVDRTLEEFGRLDVMVNNAGIEIAGNITDLTEEQFDTLIAVNLKGVFFGTQRAAIEMMKAGKGKIINTASVAAVVGGPFMSLYATAKGGIVALTKSAAVELASSGIMVNALCPGFIETGMTAPALSVEAMRKIVLDKTPLEVIGDPLKDIAPLAVYLASNESDFMTGQAIVIDGGYSVV